MCLEDRIGRVIRYIINDDKLTKYINIYFGINVKNLNDLKDFANMIKHANLEYFNMREESDNLWLINEISDIDELNKIQVFYDCEVMLDFLIPEWTILWKYIERVKCCVAKDIISELEWYSKVK